MNPKRAFLVALAISVALHVVVISGPGWYLPILDDLLSRDEGQTLEAHLLVPPVPVAQPVAKPKPRKARPKPPAPAPAPVAAAEPLPEPVPEPVPEPAPTGEDPPAQPEAEPTPLPDEPGDVRKEAPLAPEPERAEGIENVVDVRDGGPTSVTARLGEIALPRFARIRYRVTYGSAGFLVGEATQELRHDGSNYLIRSVAETTGIVRMFRRASIVNISFGTIARGQFRPEEFRVERSGKTEVAKFNWTSHTVVLSNGREIDLPANTQDMVSMVCQLALMPSDGPVISMPVLTSKVVERYDFKVLGIETVVTSWGQRKALHLLNTQPDGVEKTEVWLGLEDGRLPIKIMHVDRRGDRFDQIAEHIEYEEMKEQRP